MKNKFTNIFINKRYWLLFFLILLIAGIIRGYKLGDVPHGMTWDEAAIGYNGFAIWKVHRDEWLNKMPISFRSFGDYKAPFAIYLNGLFTLFFGMSLWAVRLPFFLASIVAIAGFMLLIKQLFSEKLSKYESQFKNPEGLSLFAGLLITLSPWHIHYSRTGFESGIALCFVIWGVYLFLKFINSQSFKGQLFWLMGSVCVFVLSIYTYHSAKVVTPLLALILFIFYLKKMKGHYKSLMIGSLLGLAALLPFIQDSLFGSGAQRLGQASFIKANMSLSQIVGQFINQYLSHFTVNYLILGQTITLRHGDGVWGVLFFTTFILMILGILIAVFKRKIDKVFFLSILWIVVGTIPSAIGEDVPHSNRALLALPGFLLLATWSFDKVIQLIKSMKNNQTILGSHGERELMAKSFIGTFILIHLLLSATYLNHYFVVFAKESAVDFKDGYLEAFSIAKDYEKGLNGRPQVDQIVFSNDYGQAYIYALFARKTDPIWYQGGSLNNYLIKEIDHSDFSRKNTLVVASGEDDFGLEKATHVVMGSDGEPKFIFYYLKGDTNDTD